MNGKFYALVRYTYDRLDHEDNYKYADMYYKYPNSSRKQTSHSHGIFPIDEATEEEAIKAMNKYVIDSFEIEDGDDNNFPSISSQKFKSVYIISADSLIPIDFQQIHETAKKQIDQEIAETNAKSQRKNDLEEYKRLKKLFENDNQ